MEDLTNVIDRRSLRYDFTMKERQDLSILLANKTKEISMIEDEKKSVNSQYKAKLDELQASCNKLANQVSDGFEIRDVEVEVKYHEPEHGMKTLVRKDGGKDIVEKMEVHEFNLFNQPQDMEDSEKSQEEEDFFGMDEPAIEKKKRGRKKKSED